MEKEMNENEIDFSIKERTWKIPGKLKELAERLKFNTMQLISLIDTWDEEDTLDFGTGPDIKALQHASDFVIKYSSYILKKYGKVLFPPYITFSDKGSIDIDWDESIDKYKTNKCFLINVIPGDDGDAHYYACDGNKEMKGQFYTEYVNIDETFPDEIL